MQVTKADAVRFLSFAFASADLLFEVAADKKIVFAMGATSGLTEMTEQALMGQDWRQLLSPDDATFVTALTDSLDIGTRCGPVLVRLALQGPDGNGRQALFSACRLQDGDGKFACTLSHVSLATREEAALRRRDAETQLLDKDTFADVAGELVKSAKELGQDVGMTMLDVPDMSALKGRMEKKQAKELVATIGALLRSASVDGNAAGLLGENRFGIVHDKRTDTGALTAKIEGLTKKMDPTGAGLSVAKQSVDISADGLSPDEAVRAIQYTINRFATLKPGEEMPSSISKAFETMVEETVAKMSNFATMVRDDNFALAYQPIVGMSDRHLHHFEVLARFEAGHSPFEMIQFAEEIGIIERFDLAVATRAFKTLADPKTGKDVSLAVNVSGRSIQNGLFIKCLEGLLDQYRHLNQRIAFEITESAELKDLEQVNKIVQRIRQRGYLVCLDDFGAGSASFQYLQALDIDFVKIDGAYVKRLGQSPRDDAMLKGIVRLCVDLGVGTIAEMVETAAQADMLEKMGVTYGQGWLYGKATPEPVYKPPVNASLMAAAKKEAEKAETRSGSMLARRRGTQEGWG